MSTAALILSAPNAPGFTPALVLGSGLPREIDLPGGKKAPCGYYWKESLPLGRYHDAKGKPFEVTASRIDNIIRDFNRAKAKGYKPSCPDDHRKRTRNFGWVIDARKNAKGSLELLHQIVGEDAILEVARNKSSICTLSDVTDEHGEKYSELIDHNCITDKPQLNGLADFVPVEIEPALAASRGPATAEVFELAASTEEPTMDLSKLRKALGLADATPDADVLSQAEAKIGGIPAAITAAETPLKEQVTALSRERDEARGRVTELSRTAPQPPSARELYLSAKTARQAREKALASRVISPAVADKLEAQIVGTDTKVLTLSRTPQAGDERTVAGLDTLLAVYEALEGNTPVPKDGEETGAQVLELDRTTGGDGKVDYAKVAAETTAKILAQRHGHHAPEAKKAG